AALHELLALIEEGLGRGLVRRARLRAGTRRDEEEPCEDGGGKDAGVVHGTCVMVLTCARPCRPRFSPIRRPTTSRRGRTVRWARPRRRRDRGTTGPSRGCRRIRR